MVMLNNKGAGSGFESFMRLNQRRKKTLRQSAQKVQDILMEWIRICFCGVAVAQGSGKASNPKD